jgi:hypothetical protein
MNALSPAPTLLIGPRVELDIVVNRPTNQSTMKHSPTESIITGIFALAFSTALNLCPANLFTYSRRRVNRIPAPSIDISSSP